jgi:hypothetical protein
MNEQNQNLKQSNELVAEQTNKQRKHCLHKDSKSKQQWLIYVGHSSKAKIQADSLKILMLINWDRIEGWLIKGEIDRGSEIVEKNTKRKLVSN